MGWMHLMIFTQIILDQIYTRQCKTKNILNIFQKVSVIGFDDYQFSE